MLKNKNFSLNLKRRCYLVKCWRKWDSNCCYR